MRRNDQPPHEQPPIHQHVRSRLTLELSDKLDVGHNGEQRHADRLCYLHLWPRFGTSPSELHLPRTSTSVVQTQRIRVRTTAEGSAGNPCIGSYCIRVPRRSTPMTPLRHSSARADVSLSSYHYHLESSAIDLRASS
ncbi:hypothetical protein BKA70DRAFT_1558914 [Coprinopsis sp. MPI-PUGE-AT-0042]|nr:hypothetical protein BKA70DRAFT_1558914 [Coprinopsis sp. MPI-PUGE-AT-0042]